MVIVDEAQDLSESNGLLVEALAGEGMLWAFHDPAQAFWAESAIRLMRALAAIFRLISMADTCDL